MTFQLPSSPTSAGFLFSTLIGSCHLFHVSGNDGRCEPCSTDSLEVLISIDETCQDLISATGLLAADTMDCKDAQLLNFQNKCCEEPPRGSCTLCPDGSLHDANALVPSFDPNAGELSCSDLTVDPSFLDYVFEKGACSDTLLRRSAAWCGCPGVERSCFLCPDGSPPPNPILVDPVYYGWSCASFDFVSSYFSAEECRDLVEGVFEFDAPSWCGCPNVPIPSVCRLCPEGQQIVQPHEVLGADFTCQQLALSTRYISSEGACDRVVNSYQAKGYVDTCCGSVNSSAMGQGGTQGLHIVGTMALLLVTLGMSYFVL